MSSDEHPSHGHPGDGHSRGLTFGRFLGIVALGVVLVLVITQVARFLGSRSDEAQRQDQLQSFYTPPDPLPSTVPGTLLRIEPLGQGLPGATTYRILYVSQWADGSPSVSSGMLVVPDSKAPADGRTVVAWAHGTSGLGDSCAASRRPAPMTGQSTEPWMIQMVEFGWTIVATDYSGLGTPGVSQYLIGRSEAYDVVNSVRAARQFEQAHASKRWVVWGHSQGGHASLWTGALARTMAPELDLVAVAAAAPAAELVPLVTEQWNQAAAWVIGPEVVYAWPTVYPDLPVSDVVDKQQLDATTGLAQECLVNAAIGGLARQKLGRTYFTSDPGSNAAWKAALTEQTPPPITDLPVLVLQGTADPVVIPNTTSLLNTRWCAAGANLSTVWLGGQGHSTLGERAGTIAGEWFFRILNGEPEKGTCDVPNTVPAYPTPVDPGFGTSAS